MPMPKLDEVEFNASPDYIPAVGDVVEVPGDRVEWLVLNINYYGEKVLGVVADGHRWNRVGGCTTGMRLIRHTDSVSPEHLDVMDAYSVATKYFAQSFTPDPALSYAENQAAWVKFHGIGRGSLLKVVRSFRTDEDGYRGGGRDDTGLTGKILVFQGDDGIRLTGDVDHWCPYFVLEPVT